MIWVTVILLAAAWRRSPNLFLSFDDILGETGFQQKRRISSVCVCVCVTGSFKA